MAKRGRGVDQKGRSKGKDSHARFYWWEVESPAYRDLNVYARALLVEMKTEYTGRNNGAFFLSIRDAAERLNCCKTTAAQAFHDLMSHGFARPHQRGEFHWKPGMATTWMLTEYEFAGQLPTKDFLKWRPVEKQNSVRLVGQGRPPRGHLSHETDRNGVNRPTTRTDSAEIARKPSYHTDTVKLPGGVGNDTGPAATLPRRREPQFDADDDLGWQRG